MTTVAELLRPAVERLRAAGSETARLDAELLLGHAVGADRTTIIAHPDAPVGDGTAARFAESLARRERGEPVAYIRGMKEFMGLAFVVDARALIPRPETELLVELAEAEVVRRLVAAPRPPGTPALRVADVGTGSGAIAVTLAVRLRGRRMAGEVALLASDVSADALDLAKENAVGHAVADGLTFAVADLLPGGGWDLVLANLPYVRADAIAALPVATSFEPRLALDGGADGLEVIGRLLDRLPAALAPEGLGLLEIGGDQGEAALALVASRLPGWAADAVPDLGGLPRVLRVRRDGGTMTP